MVGWHHRLDGHEFEQAPGVGDGQGKYQSQLPFPSPGDLPDPGINSGLLHCRQILLPFELPSSVQSLSCF